MEILVISILVLLVIGIWMVIRIFLIDDEDELIKPQKEGDGWTLDSVEDNSGGSGSQQ